MYLPVLVLAFTVGGAGALLASDYKSGEGNLIPQPVNAKWQAECGSCHVAYPPALLPERSWRKMMAGLKDHFGEDASLDPAATREITDYLAAHSAEKGAIDVGRKVARSTADDAVPLRITETRWVRHEHDDVRPEVWKRKSVRSPANCGACHRDAEKGLYSEGSVQIPR
jgi:cytochrome c553